VELAEKTMTDQPHHVLTLVIQKDADIPRIRSKVKLLVRAIGAPVLQVTGLAVGASETARLLLQLYGGGKVRISLFPQELLRLECGVELLFQGNSWCLKGDSCPLDKQALLSSPPFPGLQSVFDTVQVQGGIRGRKIIVTCRSIKSGIAWEEVHSHLSFIRKELFADTEESYLENLRAKHDEVVRLLREKTEKNQLLDQSNNELLQLSNHLEKLARERTIIEMSLRVADQVRNPATVIGGMARRLLEKENLTDQGQQKINLIAKEADKIEDLVKQFNSMAAERRTLFSRESLPALLQDALQACPTFQRKNLQVKLDVPSKSCEIHANRQILKVALVHVLRYFTQKMAVGEELTIHLESSPELLLTFAARLKPGKDEDHGGVEVISKPDTQAGLALVQQILSEHQAELEIKEDTDDRQVLSIHFPRVFHEQQEISNGSL
jgi:hypothetical protein